MRIVEIAEAQATLAEYASGLTEEPVIITSNGQPVAALVTLENVDLETISLSTNPKFMELIERSRTKRRNQGGLSSAEMRQRLGLSQPNVSNPG
ncbi:MAG: type II toxin-antitoxin system prevent-host-death family antitoxin [Oculatellaceae cyanobacterium Prado106]|jgi:prevent-host-death family protein|nr:type II toxin-antitoxin system prevent-host-death family antitoxin [Oculatellaceae cyanobacterium Prado106]